MQRLEGPEMAPGRDQCAKRSALLSEWQCGLV